MCAFATVNENRIALACPICKYPLGSGGKRVIIAPLVISLCFFNKAYEFTDDSLNILINNKKFD